MRRYECFGLSIDSEFPLPLPEIPAAVTAQAAAAAAPADLAIVSRNLPFAGFSGGGFEELAFDAGGARYLPLEEGVLVRLPGSGDFLAASSRIEIVADAGLSEEEVGDLAARLALGFVLQVRGKLAFHGAALSRGGRALAILGDRGSGKSTAARALAGRGFGMLSDDIVALGPDGLVPRGLLRSRLNPDSFGQLEPRVPPVAARRGRDGKYAIDAPLPGEPAPLGLAIALEVTETGGVRSREQKGYAKLQGLLAHLHAPAGIGSTGGRLKAAAAAFAAVPMRIVARPSDRWAIGELADELERLFVECAGGADGPR